MSVFSNDLAPNLFKSYTDWFDNWVKETGHKPEKHVDDMACIYFDVLECNLCRETIAENAMFKKTSEFGDNKDD